jgi:hypothetical protein
MTLIEFLSLSPRILFLQSHESHRFSSVSPFDVNDNTAQGFGQLSPSSPSRSPYSASSVVSASSLKESPSDVGSLSGNNFRLTSHHVHQSPQSFGIQMTPSLSLTQSQSPSSTGPIYFKSMFVLVMTVASVVVIVAFSIAYAYVKLEEKKVSLMQAGYTAGVLSASPSRNFQFMSGNQSYPTSSKSSPGSENACLTMKSSLSPRTWKQPLISRPPVPSGLWSQQQSTIEEESDEASSSSNPYQTLPFQRMQSFIHPYNQNNHNHQKQLHHVAEIHSQSPPSCNHSSCQEPDRSNNATLQEDSLVNQEHRLQSNINIHVNHCPPE